MPILVVYSDHDLASSHHTGVAGNAPEERKRLVQKELRSSPLFSFFHVTSPERSILELGSLVHDKNMLQFLISAWEKWTLEWHKKPSNHHLIGVFCSPDSTAQSSSPPLFCAGFFAPRNEPSSAYSETSVLSQICYFAMDKETPLSSTTLSSLEWDLSVIRHSVQALSRNEVVYAQITHPGHHAFRANFGGFCFLNQAAIAVQLLLQQYARVCVVDVDFHAGNGTSSIFWDNDRVLVISLHADPALDYPFNCGFASQNRATTVNVILPPHCNWSEYERLLREQMVRVNAFQPQALVVSLGVDTLRGDPVALPHTRCQLDPHDYGQMGKILLGHPQLKGIPKLVVQEGGYKLDDVPLAIKEFLSAAAGMEGKL